MFPELKIDEEFRTLMPRLSVDEYSRLKRAIIEDGCRDSIIIWGDIIVDGMHRYLICQEISEQYTVTRLDFPDRDAAKAWIIDNQLARRNLTTWQKGELASHKLDQLREKTEPCPPADKEKKRDVYGEAARVAGVSRDTVAKAIRIRDRATPEQLKRLGTGESTLGQVYDEIKVAEREGSAVPKFNRTKIDWARWSWCPYTGCLGPGGGGPCGYCFAAGFAERFYTDMPKGKRFEPRFRPERLSAPFNTKIPSTMAGPGATSVFVCSMGDLFGKWVPDDVIDQVLDVVRRVEREGKRKAPKFPLWNFIFLTKNPPRLPTINWPSNAWVGVTVDRQFRVKAAVEALNSVNARVKFLSCEPFLEPLNFMLPAADEPSYLLPTRMVAEGENGLSCVDWAIFGACTATSTSQEKQPEWPWVEDLMVQARFAGCMVYFKKNLTCRPKEYPRAWEGTPAETEATEKLEGG